MNENVYWVLELEVQPNRGNEFINLMRDMVDAASAETGTLNYEWNISAGGSLPLWLVVATISQRV